VRSTDIVVNVTGGLAADVAGVVKASAAFNYKQAHGYPMFSRTSENMWEVTYTQTTRISSIESEVYVDLGASLVGVKVLLQQSRAEAGRAESVPYLPEVSLSATAQHAFAMGLRVASDVRYTGRRFADLRNTRSLSAYCVWDLRAEYGERILVGAKLTNILDRREGVWEGYAGEPRGAMLSIGYTW
jgi:outer membrane cobalamin receptor